MISLTEYSVTLYDSLCQHMPVDLGHGLRVVPGQQRVPHEYGAGRARTQLSVFQLYTADS